MSATNNSPSSPSVADLKQIDISLPPMGVQPTPLRVASDRESLVTAFQVLFEVEG